jgi:hypothetical protein
VGARDLAALARGPAELVVHEAELGGMAEAGEDHSGVAVPIVGGAVEAADVGADDAALVIEHHQAARPVDQVVGHTHPAVAGIGGLEHVAQGAVDGDGLQGAAQVHGGQVAAGLHGGDEFPGLGGGGCGEEDKEEE